MPSTKDPNQIVNPGPGRLPADVVPAGALMFSPGGGGGAALQAHINNPHDAHMAHAIGVDPFYPPTGQPILSSVGGVVDGESVLDFINQFKDLIPARPNSIGFNLAGGVTSGIPVWGLLDALGVGTGTSVTGGYAQGTNVTASHYLVPNGTSTFTMAGLLFPADRGVVAFYKNTSGDFFDAPNTTLVAALSLGDPPAPIGIPDAAFNELTRNTAQPNYVASGLGLDLISLTFRHPYLSNYSAYPGTPYGPFSTNFFGYQLAEFALSSQSISVGNAQDFLIVHWKETYATSLASIQPVNLTLVNLVAANCYSAVPVAGNFDDNTQPVYNVNRHNVFRDSDSATAPTGGAWTSAQNGVPTTVPLSGVQFYDNGGTALTWTVDVTANDLFGNSFNTGSVDNPPNVPTQFHSAFDPVVIDFGTFGGGLLKVPYYAMHKAGPNALYSITNTPVPADVGEYQNALLSIVTPVSASPAGGFGTLKANLRDPFHTTPVVFPDPKKDLFNSFPQTGGGTASTDTFEPFVDEKYRYIITFDPSPSATVPILPAGGDVFPSSTPFVVTGPDLQEVGNLLLYPQVDYSAALFRPVAQPNYSGFPAGDGALHLRRYQRAFDTGIARNTGKIRIRGLAQAAFTTNAPYNGVETTGHTTGGAIIQIKVPGAGGTGWLDLGRAFGDPGLSTLDFYGCSTGVVVSGPDVTVTFNTTAFTSSNGSGKFLLFIRVTLINGNGTPLSIDELQWLPP